MRRWLPVFESDLPRLSADLEALVRHESPCDDPQAVWELADPPRRAALVAALCGEE
jgi:hypothetical protein